MKAAGFERASLWVLANNDRAIAFYERTGWTRDGATKTEQIGDTVVTEVRFRRELP